MEADACYGNSARSGGLFDPMTYLNFSQLVCHHDMDHYKAAVANNGGIFVLPKKPSKE